MQFKKETYKSNVVYIGSIALGGDYAVRIQSMVSIKAGNPYAMIDQCIKLAVAGADYVRITAPNLAEVENIKIIKETLRKAGFNAPLIADVHDSPQVAEMVATIVEKVRINPGNYVDKRRSKKTEYSDDEYRQSLEKLRKKFKTLIDICKEHNTTIRIGVNHGSLSKRVVSRYGNTITASVESAMEYLRVCKEENFHPVVVSIKASNTRTMVHAYRLLVKTMISEGMNYPLHVGLTEAGSGEYAQIKSAVGIGTLLAAGIGDTIRVSLTGDPVPEIAVAQKLLQIFPGRSIPAPTKFPGTTGEFPTEYSRRKTIAVKNIGGQNYPVVISGNNSISDGKSYSPEFIYLSCADTPEPENSEQYIIDFEVWKDKFVAHSSVFPIFTVNRYLFATEKSKEINFVLVSSSLNDTAFINIMKMDSTVVLILDQGQNYSYTGQIDFFNFLAANNCLSPVILHHSYCEPHLENFQLAAACHAGSLLFDGFGDGIWLSNSANIPTEKTDSCAYDILQAARVRFSKAEVIACPTCGRTVFDFTRVYEEVKKATAGQSELVIAVMGCEVNGLGEMADAMYGLLCSGKGKFNLYREKELVKKNITAENAVEELVALIKADKKWK